METKADVKTEVPVVFEQKTLTWKTVSWKILIIMVIMHLVALTAPIFFSWWAVGLFVFMWWLCAGVGITLCYHRMLTHRGFKTPRWFQYVLMTIGCMNWQGSPRKWCGVHREHHAKTDQPGDPHSPNHGFTEAHVLWTVRKHTDEEKKRFDDGIPDLIKDPIFDFFDRIFVWPQLVLIPLFAILGEWMKSKGFDASGISFVVWGVALRTVFVWHGTWFVNSAAHTWGYQNYKTGDRSTNLWWVAFWALGEGWHNNHHDQQWSARHGHRWFEFDPTYWLIVMLSWVGLVRDIRAVKNPKFDKVRHSDVKAPRPNVLDSF